MLIINQINHIRLIAIEFLFIKADSYITDLLYGSNKNISLLNSVCFMYNNYFYNLQYIALCYIS